FLRSHSFAAPLALEYNTTPASLWQALFSLFSIFFALLGVLDSFFFPKASFPYIPFFFHSDLTRLPAETYHESIYIL
ncbi:MAG: hypothetical protein ACI4JC_02670, partial [Faecalibacterium sp.]